MLFMVVVTLAICLDMHGIDLAGVIILNEAPDETEGSHNGVAGFSPDLQRPCIGGG